jgi:hypothetical protein
MSEEKIKTLEHQIQHILNFRIVLDRNMNYLKKVSDALIIDNKQLREALQKSNEKITDLEVKISNLEIAQFTTTPSKF